jgi:muramoyltetrapeptide carboxypeptidase
MINPPFLRIGDCVRLVSPAGAINPVIIDEAETCLRSWGLNVIRGKFVSSRLGRFSGSISQRLFDFQEAFDDPECKAIFCSRGGYGSVHLLSKIDFACFHANPKWLIGYSDITLLHACLQIEGFTSIHGGMAKVLVREAKEPAMLLHDLLWGKMPEYGIKHHLLNRIGKATGPLHGGNLSILYSLRGTPYDNIPKGAVLFIEDVGEKPYAIDRMMYNLKLGGILKNLSGLIIGQFSDYEEDPDFGKSVYEIIYDAISEYSYPVCFDFPVGHVDLNLPLIMGHTVNFEVNQEGAVLSYI